MRNTVEQSLCGAWEWPQRERVVGRPKQRNYLGHVVRPPEKEGGPCGHIVQARPAISAKCVLTFCRLSEPPQIP
jgi:hypothetical protein